MKKLDWLIIAILLLSPIGINYLILGVSLGVTINGSPDGWLSYYGNLVGSLITMFILYRTRVWNKEDNTDTKISQNKILQYQAKTVWFEGLRKQLDLNYRILNFQETIIAANSIAIGNCQTAMDYLMNLNKDIEMQGHSFDLYLSGDHLDEYETEYIECYQNLLRQYGDYVNDLILICGIKIRIYQKSDIKFYINDSFKLLEQLHKANPIVRVSGFLIKLKNIVNSPYTFQELDDICASRILDVSSIHSGKSNLQKVTNQLLKFEERKIEAILLTHTNLQDKSFKLNS